MNQQIKHWRDNNTTEYDRWRRRNRARKALIGIKCGIRVTAMVKYRIANDGIKCTNIKPK